MSNAEIILAILMVYYLYIVNCTDILDEEIDPHDRLPVSDLDIQTPSIF